MSKIDQKVIGYFLIGLVIGGLAIGLIDAKSERALFKNFLSNKASINANK